MNHEFSDDCPGCRPAIMDLRTQKVLPEDSPEMVAIAVMWAETTLNERLVFHRVTCRNSRDPNDLKIFTQLGERMGAVLRNLEKGKS